MTYITIIILLLLLVLVNFWVGYAIGRCDDNEKNEDDKQNEQIIDPVEISKLMIENKYKCPVSKNDTFVYMTDIPKVIDIIQKNYKILKN